MQPVKSRLSIPSGRRFGVQECTTRSAAATDPQTSQGCHSPPFAPLGTSKNDSHSSREQSWHGLKQTPLSITGFMMFSGEHSQNDPSAEEICWHTQLLPLHCLKNATRLCLWVPSQTQQPPAQSGWHWVDAKMRSGCWATEQMLWLLLQEVCQMLSLPMPTYHKSPL